MARFIVQTSNLTDAELDNAGLIGQDRISFWLDAEDQNDAFTQLRNKLGLSGAKVNSLISEASAADRRVIATRRLNAIDDVALNSFAGRNTRDAAGNTNRSLNSELEADASGFSTAPVPRTNNQPTFSEFASGAAANEGSSVANPAIAGSLPGAGGAGGPQIDLPEANNFTFMTKYGQLSLDAISESNARAQLKNFLVDQERKGLGTYSLGDENGPRRTAFGPATGRGWVLTDPQTGQPVGAASAGGGGASTGGGNQTGTYTSNNTVPVFPGLPDPGQALASAGTPSGATLERPAAEALQPGEAFRAFLQQSGVNPDSFGGNLFQSQLGPALTALAGLGSGVEGAGDATLSGLLGAGPIGPGRFGRLAAAALPGATANITGQPGFQALGAGGTFTDQGALLANLSRLSRGVSPFASQFVNPSNADIEQQLRDFTFAQNTGTGGPAPSFENYLSQVFAPIRGGLTPQLRAQAGF